MTTPRIDPTIADLQRTVRGLVDSLGQSRAVKQTEIVSVTSNPYDARSIDRTLLVDASNGGITIRLPPLIDSESRAIALNVKKTDSTANKVIIQPNGSDKIEGSTSLEFGRQGEVKRIEAATDEWKVV